MQAIWTGPSRASSGHGAINSTGPCVGVAVQGQEGATTNANQFKTLTKHWYSIMQSSNCSMLMHISPHIIVKLTSKKVIINQSPSIRTTMTNKEVLGELTNERPTNGFLNVILY